MSLRSFRRAAPVGLVVALALAPAPAARADSPKTSLSILAPGANGQLTLAVTVIDGSVRAKACEASAACDASHEASTPEADRGRARSDLSVIKLENGRSVVRVGGKAPGFSMLLAAPLAGQGQQPIVFFAGDLGTPRGEAGEARTNVMLEQPHGGGVRVVLGVNREDVTICGRPALSNVNVLDPSTLRFERGVALGDSGLSAVERAKATKLTAARLDGAVPARALRLLGMRTASSSAVATSGAKDAPAPIGALTDGDLDTAWSEGKPGDGQGEFVAFTSATEVPIAALEIAVKPAGDVPGGAAPRSFYVATPEQVFSVTMPEDAWAKPPRTRYAITFPEPLRTTCLALVLDTAFTRGSAKDARVTLSEVTARTPYDEMSQEALVGALAGGGERARGAGAMLEQGGAASARAVMAGYAKLDDASRELARRVADLAPCSEQVPFYAARFAEASAAGKGANAAPGDVNPEFIHARDRLRSCKTEGTVALVKLLGHPSERTRHAAADELPLVSPSAAVHGLVEALAALDAAPRPAAQAGAAAAHAKPLTKSDLLAPLAVAARSERARAAVALELEPATFAARSESVRVSLLRAVGPQLAHMEGAAAAFATLADPAARFETRFLLQAPAGELARGGDARATEFLRASLARDADAHVRRRAASVASAVPALAPDLARAVDDADMRVREAAIDAIASSHAGGAAAPALARRLAADDWPFVRASAARALADAPPSPSVDAALTSALGDASADVRGGALDAIGTRRVASAAPAVRELAGKTAETPEVRVRALLALGALCDRESVGALVDLVKRSADPTDEIGKRLAPSALASLAAIHPPDLEARLAPVLTKQTPGPVRNLAAAALRAPASCR